MPSATAPRSAGRWHAAWSVLGFLFLGIASGGEVPTDPTPITITVHGDGNAGRLRPLHGTNLGPYLPGEGTTPHLRDCREALRALAIPLTRLHDAPLDNPGRLLVDIPLIFPLFHADPADARNYLFRQTDDYIATCLDTGTRILYRLGPSIEHGRIKYQTAPPADPVRWADICINVIRHYNEGWADGFHHGITHWEIWNEPDLGPRMWSGSWQDYIDFYVVTARRIKERFPALKIGGPGMSALKPEPLRALITACRERKAPLDFLSWHCYTRDPTAIIREPGKARALLAEQGFEDSELILDEWHYFPGDWRRRATDRDYRRRLDAELTGSDSAAFITAVLSGWQDGPLTMANHYVGTHMGAWGLFDELGAPNRCYHAFRAFSILMRHPRRMRTTGGGAGVWVIAGQDDQGAAALLLTCFQGGGRRISILLDAPAPTAGTPHIRLLDGERWLDPIAAEAWDGHRLTLPTTRGSAVFLVEWPSTR